MNNYEHLSREELIRKLAELEYQKSDVKIRSLFQGAPIGMGILKDRIVMEVNDRVCEITGYSKEELIGQDTRMVYLTDEDYESVGRKKESLLAKGKVGSAETRFRRKDGSIINVIVSTALLDHNDPSAGATFTVMDITEHKLIESERQRSVAQYDALFNQMTEGLVIFDPEGNLLEMNPAALAIHGINQADGLGKNLDALSEDVFELFDLKGNLLPTEEWPIGRVLQGETFEKYEVEVRSRNTGRSWVGSYGGTPVKGIDGRLLIAIVTLRDITAQKEAEAALRSLNETLEQKVAERSALAEERAKQLQSLAVELVEAEEFERRKISDFLHDDLQQVIASIRMQVQLASEKDDPLMILKNVERLLGVSLEKSRRLAHELSPPVLYQFGLPSSLEWLVRNMDEKFGMKVLLEIEMTHQIKDATLKVFIFRAVQELLFNSAKYSGEKSANISIHGTDKEIVLYVSDNGQGFDPGILDSFQRKSGLGLLSLRERAAAIGGNLNIESAPGQGSLFILTVPFRLTGVHEPAEITQVIAKEPEIFEKAAKVSNSEMIRVLFADDHKVMRQGLIGLVANNPDIHVAGEAANGEEAVTMARHLRPDLVVMDISMPKMDGVEATCRIKAEMPEVRVIGLSMFDDENVSRKMREAGADGFVSKSDSASELLKAIYGVAAVGKDGIEG